MSKRKRIVCYAINGAGMGHVTRLMTVAKWLRRYGTLLDQRPPEIIFLTSSDASDMLADAGFAAFKIPSKTVAQRTELDKPEYKRLAKHFVWNTLGVFAPDLLVVDTFPSGSFDELFQLMDGPFKKSFICRKVKPDYANRPTFRSALRLYDAIVAPHAESRRFDLPLPAEAIAKISFSGEVVQQDACESLSRAACREELGIGEKVRLVYISAGGGGDPGAEQALRQIIGAVSSLPDVHLLVGAGPLFRGDRVTRSNVTWFTETGVGRYFAGLDAAISAAGYNTFHELLLARVPAIFFSQHKIADDQQERVQQAENVGACHSLQLADEASDASNARIVAALNKILEPDVAASIRAAAETFLPNNGAARCAIELLKPLYQEDRLAWAQRVLTPNLAYQIESTAADSKSLSFWLETLLPQEQVRSLAGDARLEKLVNQLSPVARAEVKEVMQSDPHDEELHSAEDSITKLLQVIREHSTPNNQTLNGEVQRTVTAIMKKQTLENELTNHWVPWVCGIVNGVRKSLEQDHAELSMINRLMLLRMFPKIVDADVVGSFELFQAFVRDQLDRQRTFDQIYQSVQLLKLSSTRVTRELVLGKINQPIST